jgi:predicted CDP-diglyceride synthetase/phosphatidate cytidylyltransferase
MVKKKEGYWSLLIQSILLVTLAASNDKLCFIYISYLALREFCASFDQIVVVFFCSVVCFLVNLIMVYQLTCHAWKGDCD